ncbi:MAG: MBL fold metallo-hydrolase [Proteiniphilum sp.]|nr:MBL fold metallo-hydrolase [Proteiniphilum sp.]MEA4918960.1 MBL fold metallo-hydrolase [Proteiniphilum sp.]
MSQPKFGKLPKGERLTQIQQSPNYKDGEFRNLSHTPSLTGGQSMVKTFYNFLFKKAPRTRPMDEIPSVKTDLKALPSDENILVWFGHSSYYMQVDGIRFLIDPVFSGNASPIPNTNKSFKGTDVYSADNMPEIDYLLISHDHYDHLDYPTIKKLKPKIKHVICGLGVGAHFERWKFDPTIITEKDWNESMPLSGNMTLYTVPARHFSGRSFKRNKSLWLAYILRTEKQQLFLGGDGGYDTHFAEIGEKFGGFDLAILENGQYNQAWHAIHLMPEEGLQVAKELKAKRLFPVHSSKFKLAHHPWDEPLRRITELNEEGDQLPLVTPKIGEVVYLNDTTQVFSKWWEGVR